MSFQKDPQKCACGARRCILSLLFRKAGIKRCAFLNSAMLTHQTVYKIHRYCRDNKNWKILPYRNSVRNLPWWKVETTYNWSLSAIHHPTASSYEKMSY